MNERDVPEDGQDASDDEADVQTPEAAADASEVAEADAAGGPDLDRLACILEAALLAGGEPLSVDRLQALFREEEAPGRKVLRAALAEVSSRCTGRGFELVEVGSGFRLQVRQDFSPWISRLWEERPPRYSRALLETLAIIAYRQPVTRGDIEEVRGVAVSTNIIRTLLEREWVRVVGHRDVPGKPAMYGTTRQFLDYFGLKGLDDLPTLAELKDMDALNAELPLEDAPMASAAPARSDDTTAVDGDADASAGAADDADAAAEQASAASPAPDAATAPADDDADPEADSGADTDSAADNDTDGVTEAADDNVVPLHGPRDGPREPAPGTEQAADPARDADHDPQGAS